MSQEKEAEFFTVDEIATKLKVNPVTINRLLSAYQLGGTRVGKQWRISQADYDRFIKANSTQVETVEQETN